jgi:hypothetical protein
MLQKILSALDIAASVVDELGTIPTATSPQLEQSIDAYLSSIKVLFYPLVLQIHPDRVLNGLLCGCVVQEIHGTLAAHSHLVTNYRPCARSAYAAIKISEMADEKARIIRSRLREMIAEVEDDSTVVAA